MQSKEKSQACDFDFQINNIFRTDLVSRVLVSVPEEEIRRIEARSFQSGLSNSKRNRKTKKQNKKNILDLLDELIQDHKEQSNLKKIESLEKELINNLDENSYSELIKLKNQLNRE